MKKLFRATWKLHLGEHTGLVTLVCVTQLLLKTNVSPEPAGWTSHRLLKKLTHTREQKAEVSLSLSLSSCSLALSA